MRPASPASQPAASSPADPVLRFAEARDADRLLHWRNDPWIVARCSSQRQVSRLEHQRWFAGALDRRRHLLFIVRHEGRDVGTVRVDRRGPRAGEVSILLVRPATGRGLGPRAIRAACQEAFARWLEVQRLVARIRTENRPSHAAFARAGFTLAAEPGPAGHLVLECRRTSSKPARRDPCTPSP